MLKPIIAIPAGDPAGIGPEIIVKACADPRLADSRLVVIGSRPILEQALRICGGGLTLRSIGSVAEARFEPGTLELLERGSVDMAAFRFAEVSAMCGAAAYDCIAESIRLALERQVDAVATPPINKEAFQAAGIPYIGHTEVFGALTHTPDPLTMFEVGKLRVFFLTRHVSLRQACDMVTRERVVDYVKRCADALRRLGVGEGTMAVAGLNPHSGEHGLFGDEEQRAVVPAIEELQALGYRVEGPIGADSVFHLAKLGCYNSVLSLYHDQGHIACKTLDFERTISVTCGMPILRTSVDHGTAFALAGRGSASAVSMVEAIVTAEKYAPRFRG